jgi:hypothetical protein
MGVWGEGFRALQEKWENLGIGSKRKRQKNQEKQRVKEMRQRDERQKAAGTMIQALAW